MRYIIALAVVGLLIVSISWAANQTASAVQKRMKQKLIDAQAAGEIPAAVDLNSGNFTDFGMVVSESERWQLGILDSWYTYRIILIPTLIAIAMAIAHYWPSTKPPAIQQTLSTT